MNIVLPGILYSYKTQNRLKISCQFNYYFSKVVTFYVS